MFGLEFLCLLYNMQQTELAEKVGVSKQIVNIWMKQTRPIPKKYYARLSEIFGGLDSKYFDTYLTRLEKLEIQMHKLNCEWIAEEYEEESIDPETGEYERDENGNIIMEKKVHTNRKQELYRQMLEYEISTAKLDNRINQTLASQIDDVTEESQEISGLSDAYGLLKLYEMFVTVIENGEITRHTIKNVLKGIMLYQNSELEKFSELDENGEIDDDKRVVKKIGKIIEEEEKRLKKQVEHFRELAKGLEEMLKK